MKIIGLVGAGHMGSGLGWAVGGSRGYQAAGSANSIHVVGQVVCHESDTMRDIDAGQRTLAFLDCPTPDDAPSDVDCLRCGGTSRSACDRWAIE